MGLCFDCKTKVSIHYVTENHQKPKPFIMAQVFLGDYDKSRLFVMSCSYQTIEALHEAFECNVFTFGTINRKFTCDVLFNENKIYGIGLNGKFVDNHGVYQFNQKWRKEKNEKNDN